METKEFAQQEKAILESENHDMILEIGMMASVNNSEGDIFDALVSQINRNRIKIAHYTGIIRAEYKK